MKNIFPQADNFLDALRISWCDLCQFLHQDGSTNQVKHFDHKEHLDTGHNCRQAKIQEIAELRVEEVSIYNESV